MAGASAASEIQQIAEKIQVMADEVKRGVEFNLFSWKQLFRELERIKGQPESYGLYLLNSAVLWSVRSDSAEIKKCLDIYAAKLGKDWGWHSIRASLTPFMGTTAGVSDMLKYGYPKSNADDLAGIVEVCTQAGFFVSAAKALEELYELDAEFATQTEDESFSFIRDAVSYLLDHELPEESFAVRVTHISNVMVRNGVHLSKYKITANELGVTFEFAVDADVDRLVDLNLLISDHLGSDFPESLSEHLSIGVLPWEDA